MAAIEEQWNKSLDLAKKGERQERGFLIYYSEETGKYYIGNIQEGPIVTDPAQRATMKYLLNIDNGLNKPQDAQIVAAYHNHTLPGEGRQREVGISGEDSELGTDKNITIILKDFIGEVNMRGEIVVKYTNSPNDLETQFYFQHSN